MQKIAMEDFSKDIEIPEKEDESTELLVAIKLMADDLREALKSLHDKVNELNKINNVMVGRELKMIEFKQEFTKLRKCLNQNDIKL